MWSYGVEVPSNVVLPSTGTLQCGPAQNGRYLPTLEGTSGTLQVGRYTRTLSILEGVQNVAFLDPQHPPCHCQNIIPGRSPVHTTKDSIIK